MKAPNTVMPARSNPPKVSARRAKKIYDDVMSCKPLIPRGDMFELCSLMEGKGILAVSRRIGLAMASEGGDFFGRIASDREMALLISGQIEATESCAAALREVADLIETGAKRVRIALCGYPDMSELLVQSQSNAVFALNDASHG